MIAAKCMRAAARRGLHHRRVVVNLFNILSAAMEGSLPSSVRVWRRQGDRLLETREQAEAAAPARGELVVEVEGAVLRGPDRAVGGLVGRVVATGDEASGWLGRRVLAPEALPCGACAVCQRGRGPACASAAALPPDPSSHVRLPVRGLSAIDGPLAAAAASEPWRLAALAGPGGRVYHAFARAGLGPGELAILVGQTPEARLGERLAKIKAAQPLGVSPDRADEGEIRRLAGEPAPRVWRVFETTSTPAGIRRAIALGAAARTGTVSLILGGGAVAATLEVDLAALTEVPLLVVRAPHPELLPELVALVARGDLPLEPLTSRLPSCDLAHLGSTGSPADSAVIFVPSEMA
jgi:threonine dehydrogenase-like Zn-dependent dehydrogenase